MHARPAYHRASASRLPRRRRKRAGATPRKARDVRRIVMAKRDEYKACVAKVAASASADVLLCNARIERDIDDDIIRLCYGRRRRPNVLLILVTEGGNPDAA